MKKRWVFFVMIALAAMLGCAAAEGKSACVNNPDPADRLHLRAAASTEAESLGRYYNGTPVTVVEDSGGEWVRVTVGEKGGLQGYMKREFLAFSDADAVPCAMPQYMSTSSGWELRRSPAENAQYDMYGYGNAVQLMGFPEEWWHVRVLREDKPCPEGFVPAGANCLKPPETAVVNNPNPEDRLHLRTQPDKNAGSMGKYYNGVKVTVLSYHADQLWVKVQIEDSAVTGYMMTEYLAFGKDSERVRAAAPQGKTTVLEAAVLEEPAEASATIGLFPEGTPVTVLGVCGKYYHVEAEGNFGYLPEKAVGLL